MFPYIGRWFNNSGLVYTTRELLDHRGASLIKQHNAGFMALTPACRATEQPHRYGLSFKFKSWVGSLPCMGITYAWPFTLDFRHTWASFIYAWPFTVPYLSTILHNFCCSLYHHWHSSGSLQKLRVSCYTHLNFSCLRSQSL